MIGTTLKAETVLDVIQRLDPLPMSVNRLLEISGSADGGLEEVSEVVRFDPILSSDVLRKSNTPMYAGRDKILEVTHAVGRLGASEVLNIAMARTMQGRMAASLPQFGLDTNQLWLHSLTTSIAAETIARFSNRPGLASASIAGLIHDVGKLVLARCVPASSLMRMRDRARQEGRPMHEIETEEFGVHHGEIGGTVARCWGLPLAVQVAVIGHHPPHNSDDLLSIAVRAGNQVAHEIEQYRQNSEYQFADHARKLFGRMGLEGRDMKPLYDRILEGLESALSAYR
ncbi:MAG: HDOD domain-containing protein [Acidimicrobiales bacterium]